MSKLSPELVMCIQNYCTIKWWYSKRLGHGFWSRRPTTAHTNLHVVFLLSHGCITFTKNCSVQHKIHCWTPHNIIVNSTNFSSFDYQTFQSIELRCMSPGRCRELPMSRRRKGRKPPWPKPNERIEPSTKNKVRLWKLNIKNTLLLGGGYRPHGKTILFSSIK